MKEKERKQYFCGPILHLLHRLARLCKYAVLHLNIKGSSVHLLISKSALVFMSVFIRVSTGCHFKPALFL